MPYVRNKMLSSCIMDTVSLCIVGSGASSCQYKIQYEEAVVYSMHGEYQNCKSLSFMLYVQCKDDRTVPVALF